MRKTRRILSRPKNKQFGRTQSRAFGLGVVLSTQNPVDLDYKGLSNTGTWLIGRLQTDRDKQRVLEGLLGAATGAEAFEKGGLEKVLAGLGQRQLLVHYVHAHSHLEIFTTRCVMSYFAGPLTREKIKRLTEQKAREHSTAFVQSNSHLASVADKTFTAHR